jgi:hypothetical protein
MWNIPTEKRLSGIPRLFETERVPLKDKLIHLHYFIGGCDWYIGEFDGEDLFWGFAILNNDLQNAEWGYISFSELKAIKIDGCLEVDCETERVWHVCKASEIEKIRIANGWAKKEQSPPGNPKDMELIRKVRAGHFSDFQDLFSEVTSPYSDFFGIDPHKVWKAAQK